MTRKENEMRHVVSKNRKNVPYEGCWGYHSYNFTSPTKDRVYVKVLRFVESHPGCKRKDIREAIWGKAAGRGQCSTTFAQMLYHDILDYNQRFEYKITRKGKAILKKVGK